MAAEAIPAGDRSEAAPAAVSEADVVRAARDLEVHVPEGLVLEALALAVRAPEGPASAAPDLAVRTGDGAAPCSPAATTDGAVPEEAEAVLCLCL